MGRPWDFPGKSRDIAYLVRENNYIVFDADVSDGLQLRF